MKQKKTGGGIGIILKDGIECKRIKSTKTISFEHGIWKITTGGKSFALAVIYRSPSLEGITFNNFTNELITTLTDIMAHQKDIILLGDFNIHINNQLDPDVLQFSDTMEAFEFEQYVKSITHK